MASGFVLFDIFYLFISFQLYSDINFFWLASVIVLVGSIVIVFNDSFCSSGINVRPVWSKIAKLLRLDASS